METIKKKILLISMPSIHFDRWASNINEEKFELFWFDILNRGNQHFPFDITQIVGWQTRKKAYIKGEYFLEKKIPFLFHKIEKYLKVQAAEFVIDFIRVNRIDLVHSFEMQSCTYPFANIISKVKAPWLYSCWGNDIFYYQAFNNHKNKIIKILKQIDGLHTDNTRDVELARRLGFVSKINIVIPGGGGYDLKKYKEFEQPNKLRKIILVKGYQHQFGRGINIIKALEHASNNLQDFKIVVFAAHPVVEDYCSNSFLNIKVYPNGELSHEKVMALLGKSYIYIGNNISDGIPNTLLEAMLMGSFPIQSNPGGVMSEVIKDKTNGCLIEDPKSIREISNHIVWAISHFDLVERGVNINRSLMKQYEIVSLRHKINSFYGKFVNA